jgi:hypothetical protein
MRLLTPLGFIAALASTTTLSAQSSGDIRAFTALRATPIGALTPIITPAMISRHLNGAQLGLRYGLLDENNLRNHAIAATGIFGVGMASSVTLTAGVRTCQGCDAGMMLGAGGDMRVYDGADALGAGTALSLAVSGDLGYAQLRPGNESALSLGVGAPVTLTFGATSEGMRIAPFFTPVFGIGSTTGGCPALFPNCQTNGVRWVMGGGIGVWNPMTSISASVGVNQVILSGAKPVWGINVQLGGR